MRAVVVVVVLVAAAALAMPVPLRRLKAARALHAQSANLNALQRMRKLSFDLCEGYAPVTPAQPLEQDAKFASVYNKVPNKGEQYAQIKNMIDWARNQMLQSFRSILGQFAKDWGEKEGNAIAVAVGPIKSEDRAYTKIANDYSSNILRVLDVVRASFVFMTPERLENAVCEFRKWLPKKFGPQPNANPLLVSKRKCVIVQEKNRWTDDRPNADPTGYRDYLMNIQCEWGDGDNARKFIVELQWHLCSMMLAKQGAVQTINKDFTDGNLIFHKNGHQLYEEWRNIHGTTPQDETNKANLVNLQKTLYTRALVPEVIKKCDLDGVPKFEAQEEVPRDESRVNANDVGNAG